MTKDIKKYFADYYDRFKGYTPGEQPGTGWLKLNTNENPYDPPQSVIDDIKAGLEDLRKYPDKDTRELKKQLTFNVRVDKSSALKMDNIVAGCGSDEMLDIIFKTFVNPEDRVVFFEPSYGMYKVLCNMYRATPVTIPLNEDFTIPEEKATSTLGKLMIICSPNNPNGARVPNEIISKICNAFDGIVVVDEAYIDFADGSAIGLLKEHPNLIILRTFSKSYSLAALRVGYIITLTRDIILALRKVKLPFNVNLPAQVAALSALKHQDEFDEIIEKIKSERERLAAKINAIEHLSVLPSDANFILVKINVGAEKRNQKVTQKLFWELKKKKILVRWYMTRRLYAYLRVTIGKPEENDLLADAMEECLNIALQAA
ncbi:histidinol-phosphate transaminase [Candidatus Bathyarchaeota archaeon]|nr:histidinol-phosphate transaminase [Candidatus Bathyarchaeota archaeon]